MKIFIRADASFSIGTGHIFRTLVLVQALQEHEITFFCRDYEGLPKHRITDHDVGLCLIPKDGSLEDEKQYILSSIEKDRPDWIVVDNYTVKEDYYAAMTETGVKILAIDDINHTRFPVDVLLNQNVGSENYSYACRGDTTLLLGPQYALVNSAIREKRNLAQIRTTLKRILIFMGGSDPDNETLKMLEGVFLSQKDLELNIILGSAFQYRNEIEKFLSDKPINCTIFEDLPNLSDLILQADLGVGAGGITTWEMCTLFLPMIIAPIADNQMDIAANMAKLNAAVYPGRSSEIDQMQISKIICSLTSKDLQLMSKTVGSICDGEGINRVTALLQA